MNNRSPLVLRHETFILDAELVTALDESNMKKITTNFIKELLDVLGMEELASLGIYPAVDLRAPGWSFIQPITTSHISGHYFEKPGKSPHIHIDIYSCSEVNFIHIISIADKHLKLGKWSANFIIRSFELSDRRNILITGIGGKVLSKKLCH